MAYDLTEADLPAADPRQGRQACGASMAVGYLDAMDAKPRNFNTNWQSHRVKLATMAAFQTGDAKLIDRARAATAPRSRPTSTPTARCSTSTSATPCTTSPTTWTR
jgi:hypothetical protein